MSTPAGPAKSSLGDRRLAAILFTDVVGFSSLVESNETQTLLLVRRDLKLIGELCHKSGGDVLKNTGDGCLAAFSSVEAAVGCAIKIQRLVAHETHRLPPSEILHHRIGIHLGDVYFGGGDVLGNGVNIAARLLAEAEPNGICISQAVYDLVKHRRDVKAVSIGPRELKHIREAVQVYRVIVKAFADEQSEAAVGKESHSQAAGAVHLAPGNAPARGRMTMAAAALVGLAVIGIAALLMFRSGKPTAFNVAVTTPPAATAPVAPSAQVAPTPSETPAAAPAPVAVIAGPATEPAASPAIVTSLPPAPPPSGLDHPPDFVLDSTATWRRVRVFSNEFFAASIGENAYLISVRSPNYHVCLAPSTLGSFGDVKIEANARVQGAEPASWGLQLITAQGPRKVVRVTISLKGLLRVDLTRLHGMDAANNPLNPADLSLLHDPSIRRGDEFGTMALEVHDHKLSVLVNGQNIGSGWDITPLGDATLSMVVEGSQGTVGTFRQLRVWLAQ